MVRRKAASGRVGCSFLFCRQGQVKQPGLGVDCRFARPESAFLLCFSDVNFVGDDKQAPNSEFVLHA